MEAIFIFIKHKLNFLWRILERLNGILFKSLYGKSMKRMVELKLETYKLDGYVFRVLFKKDFIKIFNLINSQPNSDLKYFKPHGFTKEDIYQLFKNPGLLIMGVFKENQLVGYFFLRFFINRKCFVGRLIDNSHRGKGVGKVMNNIMYNIAWGMKFRCLSTISKNNNLVVKAHHKNTSMKVLKELPNNYLLIEFCK